jgi:Na+-transporting NADH:ubiquinone oxidoreductase subunit F
MPQDSPRSAPPAPPATPAPPAPRKYEARVEALRDLTHDIREITLRLVEPGRIAFSAGQFIRLELPEYELSREKLLRPYSIASSPSEGGIVQLEVKLVPGGLATTYIFSYMKEGESLSFTGPFGQFHLRDSASDAIFIAGGSGMAPIRSILLDMAERGVGRRARYFFGAKAGRDLFLVDEMRSLERRLGDFAFIPALSSPAPGEAWDGERGLITEVVERRLERGREAEAYLCGSPDMIEACVAVLARAGIPGERVYYDKFVRTK